MDVTLDNAKALLANDNHGQNIAMFVAQNYARAYLAEHARAEAAEVELRRIDAVMARRPALDQPSRWQNIEKALRFASKADAAGRRVERLQRRAEGAEAERDQLHADMAGLLAGLFAALGVESSSATGLVGRVTELQAERDRLASRVAALEKASAEDEDLHVQITEALDLVNEPATPDDVLRAIDEMRTGHARLAARVAALEACRIGYASETADDIDPIAMIEADAEFDRMGIVEVADAAALVALAEARGGWRTA